MPQRRVQRRARPTRLRQRHGRAALRRDGRTLPAPDGLTYGEVGGGARLRHLGVRRHQPDPRASATGWRSRRPSGTSSSRACWPTTGATSCRRARSPSPSARSTTAATGAAGRTSGSRRCSSATRTSSAATTSTPSTRASAASTPTARAPSSTSCSGSKILVGNAELRFPPFGAITDSRRNLYGPLPLELVFFGDTGRGLDGGGEPEVPARRHARSS